MKKVLVTGASGFVGGAVTRLLAERGFAVRATGRRRRPSGLPEAVEYQSADLCETGAARALCAGVTGVVHAAARAGVWGPAADYRRANVEATDALLDAAREAGCRAFVFTSTPSVVFNGRPIRGGDESMPVARSFPCAYPATKAQAERQVLAADRPGFRTLALRPHLVWGPGDPHLFPRVFAKADQGRLKVVGNGTNRVDLTHIDNVAEGHAAALTSLLEDRGGGRAYFLSQNEPVDLWPFIDRILDASGRPPVKGRVPTGAAFAAGMLFELLWKAFRLRGEPPMTRFVAKQLATDHWFSATASMDTLGYRPVSTKEEGLRLYEEGLRGDG